MTIADTNVISEAMKPEPSKDVLHWLAAQPPLDLYITAVTQAEILYGVELLPGGKRRASVLAVAELLFTRVFAGRILPFDSEAAYRFSKIVVARKNLGRPIQIKDQIAAIALSKNAALATRDLRDFDACGLRIVNPWAG